MSARRALVTGAAQRGGAAISRALHMRGLDVVLHHSPRSAEAALRLAAELNHQRAGSAWLWCADFTEPNIFVPDEFQQAGIEVCVCNASVWQVSDLSDSARQQADWAIHLEAHARILNTLRPTLRSVVAISDIHVQRPAKGYVWYTVSKAALEGLMLALASDWAPQIRCNIVRPGALELPPDLDADRASAIRSSIPLQRFGSFQDLAGAVVFLALDAPYVTGHALDLDGGRSRWLV
ncbi:MAG: SDR family oxidoreductase [Burkholderiales bacterium]